MSSLTQTLVPLAQILAITGSAMLSGLLAAISWVTIPTLAILPPTQAAKVWKRTAEIIVPTAPPLAMFSSACFGFVASQSYSGAAASTQGMLASPPMLYVAAAACIMSVAPFTAFMMKRTDNSLIAKAAGDEKAVGDAETRALLRKWQGLNAWRAAAVFLGGVVGTGALVLSKGR